MGKLCLLCSRRGFLRSFNGCFFFFFVGSLIFLMELNERGKSTLVKIFSRFDSQETLAFFKSHLLLSPVTSWTISR